MDSKYKAGYSSRDHFTLEFIPFVSSSYDSKIVSDTSESKKSVPLLNNFTGKEASDFYKDVIAIPSTSKPTKLNLSLKRKEKKNQISDICNYSTKNILKYAQDGNLKGIQSCLEKGEDFVNNLQDMYGWTPLMCASCEGHLSIVEYLMQNGADLNIKNKQGMTALDIANEKHNFTIVDLFENGFQIRKEESIIKQELKEEFCETCKLYFKESKTLHERSIAHLFSAKKANLTTFYHIPESNKGFQMMVKSGWDQNKGLGLKEKGIKFPIKTILKKDRSCIGRKKEIPRVTHFNANDNLSIKRRGNPAVRIIREKTLKKWQRAKLEQKNQQKEINFRRQFICDF